MLQSDLWPIIITIVSSVVGGGALLKFIEFLIRRKDHNKTADALYQYNAAGYVKSFKIHGETGTGDVSGNAHNNMPPYTTINYIIATGLTS